LVDLDSPGEHLVLLESGELDISLFGAASLFAAARPEVGWRGTPASGQDLVLRAGDAVLIPPGTGHTIANVRAGSATILGVAMFPTLATSTTEQKDPTEAPQLTAIYDPRRVNTWTTWDRHVDVSLLATGVRAAGAGPCHATSRNQLTVTRFSIGPGEGIPAHPVEGLELLAMIPNGLEVGTVDWDTNATPASAPVDERGRGRTTAQRTAHALFFSLTTAPPVRNVGPFPLTLVGVALQLSGGTSCAVAPVST
jgi:quercetin dioxygenase-like cupin family protein